MKTARIVVSMEPELKEDAEKILKKLGLGTKEAIMIFLAYVCLSKGIPFAVGIPRKKLNLRINFCCFRFKDMVEDGNIIRAEGYDETEWYWNEGAHLYFCPFCGKNVKGKGFGKFDKETSRKTRK